VVHPAILIVTLVPFWYLERTLSYIPEPLGHYWLNESVGSTSLAYWWILIGEMGWLQTAHIAS